MTHCGDEQKPILPVNREILGFGGNMTLDVEQELIRIHLRTDRRYQAKKLDGNKPFDGGHQRSSSQHTCHPRGRTDPDLSRLTLRWAQVGCPTPIQ